MAELRLEVGFATDVGLQRQRNEDSFGIYVPFPGDENPSRLDGVLIVADGMGGAKAGDRASQLAVERLRHWLASGEYLGWPEATAGPDGTPVAGALRRAIPALGAEIHGLGMADPSIRGLGSTVVMAVFDGDRVTIAHVGDSRCYRVREGRIERMTQDHSWAEQQVAAGVITPEQARVHPRRNVLTRSLGDDTPPAPDLRTEHLRPGDCFVLCSDGLTGGVTDADILAQSRLHDSPQKLAEALVRLANERDGSDNITVVVGRCHDHDEIPPTLISPPAVAAAGTAVDGTTSTSTSKLAVVLALVLGLVLGWLAHFGWERYRRATAFDDAQRIFNAGDYDQSREQLRDLLTSGLDPYRADRTFDMLEASETRESSESLEAEPTTADQDLDPTAGESAAEAGNPAAEEPAEEPVPNVEEPQ